MQHPDPDTHWKHRRRMAYTSLAALLLLSLATALGTVPPELTELAQTLSWCWAVIIGAYYGNNAADKFAERKPP